MWKTLFVVLCTCVLTGSTHMGNAWTYSGGNTNSRSGSNYAQGTSDTGTNNVFNSVIGALVANALSGGRQQQPQPQMMMPPMWSMMMPQMMNMMGKYQNQGEGYDMMGMGLDVEKLKELMHYEVIKKLYEALEMYGDYMKAKGSFKEHMDALCFMLEVNKQHGIETNQTYTETNDNTLGDLKDMMQGWEDKDIWDFLKNMINTNDTKFYEVFFRLAAVTCKYGMALDEAYEKMENAKKGY